MGEMFDIAEARMALQQKRAELMAECDANSKLQRRFDQINAQLRKSGGNAGADTFQNPLSDVDFEGTEEHVLGYEGDGDEEGSASGGSGGMGGVRKSDEFGFPMDEEKDDPWQSLRQATEDVKRSMDDGYSDDEMSAVGDRVSVGGDEGEKEGKKARKGRGDSSAQSQSQSQDSY